MHYREDRLKKLSGLIKEEVDRPEGYLELSRWLDKNLTPEEQLKLSRLTYNKEFKEAADFVKERMPEGLSLWADDELADYFAEETYRELDLDAEEEAGEAEEDELQPLPGFDDDELLGFLRPF